MWMIVNCKNGVSSYEIHRAIGVTQKTAWFMVHRIRLALQNGVAPTSSLAKFEADETFIGGKARNMHVAKRERRITGTGRKDKTAVMGILERGGKVRTTVVANRKRKLFRLKFASMSKLVPRSTPMRCSPMKAWRAIMRTRLWTMPCSTLTAAFTRTALRTSGAC